MGFKRDHEVLKNFEIDKVFLENEHIKINQLKMLIN